MTKSALYIHIPFCRRKCAYCDFYSSSGGERNFTSYMEAVKKELFLKSDKEFLIKTIYIGGGTPSILPLGAVSGLINAVKQNFNCDLTEVTVECNPESISREKLAEYRDCGVDRISLGVQSLDDKILKILGRLHDGQGAVNALKLATEYFENVSADLMIGLPFQTEEGLLSDIDTLISGGVKHLSCYALKVEEGTPLYRAVKSGEVIIPSEDYSADLYEAAYSRLKERGFYRYEVSNFALKGYESKHNSAYWKRGNYIGVGAAAHGFMGTERSSNIADTQKYIDSISRGIVPSAVYETVEGDAAEFEYIMLALRTAEGVDLKQFYSQFNVDFTVKYAAQLNKLKDFCTLSQEKYFVNEKSFYILNAVIEEFMV